MPVFHAPLSIDPRHVFRSVYSLSVVGPWIEPCRLPIETTAFIVPEQAGCFIDEHLARQYDPFIKDGDPLKLTLIELTADGSQVHRFPLVVPVELRSAPRIPDFIQLDLNYLLTAFDIEIAEAPPEQPEAEFMTLTLRQCVVVRDDDGEPDFATI